MPKLSKRWSLFAILLCGLLFWLAASVSRQPVSPDTPREAVLVRGTENTFALSSPWRNSHEVLVYDHDFHSYLVDIDNGSQTPIRFGMAYGSVQTGAIQFSPDGRWLLWATGTDNKPLWAAMDLMTSQTITRPRFKPASGVTQYDFAWLPDSRHWVQRSITGTSVPVYSIDKEQIRNIDLSSPASLTQPPGNAPPLSAFLNSSSPLEQSHGHMPSPTHDRVAWIASDKNYSFDFPAFWGMSHRTFFSLIPRQQYALWVSNTDGNNARRIVSGISDDAEPVCLNWTPDGKRLSFYSHNTLWIAPVDQPKR